MKAINKPAQIPHNLHHLSANQQRSAQCETQLLDIFKDSWWARKDLNLGPTDYESAALTAELRAPLQTSYNDSIFFERGYGITGQNSWPSRAHLPDSASRARRYLIEF